MDIGHSRHTATCFPRQCYWIYQPQPRAGLVPRSSWPTQNDYMFYCVCVCTCMHTHRSTPFLLCSALVFFVLVILFLSFSLTVLMFVFCYFSCCSFLGQAGGRGTEGEVKKEGKESENGVGLVGRSPMRSPNDSLDSLLPAEIWEGADQNRVWK